MYGDTKYFNGNSADPQEKGSDTAPEIKLPEGYDTEIAFLQEMRELFYDDMQFDRTNREAALEDLQFCVGQQWNDLVRQRREAARKPVLTINRLVAFVAQIIGQRRMNETTIKVIPDSGGTQDIAKVREGLMRSIQKLSRADIAYDKALEGSVMCGIGNFNVELAWDSDDVFSQSIRICAINDHLAPVWDRTLTESTGSDAQHVFVVDSMPKNDFTRRWPWAQPSDLDSTTWLRGELRMTGWVTVDDVRVVNYWRMRTHKREIAMLQDGSIVDITDNPSPDIIAKIMQRADGTPIVREVDKKYAQLYVCSGSNILEGPYELPISRVPVLRVPGWEVNVGEWRHRWGLIRFLKDPQRLHNYWRSVIAEKIMQTPRAVWLAAKSAVQGCEKAFRESHLSDDPLLIWNDDSGQKPERVPPAIVEDALLAQAEITEQDIKDVSNIHEANLGMPSNEVSGAAIMARQRVSDTGTVLYHDNLNQAIEQCGMICNELMAFVYNTPRIIKVLGDDSKEEMVAINGMANGPDITTGKYAVSITTGPSFATKRIEAAENMMNLANAMPQVLGVAADLIVDAQDWPMKDKIAERIRRGMPPELLDPSEISPQMQQMAQAKGQQQQQQMNIAMQTAMANYQKTQSEAALNAARAHNFEVEASLAGPKEATQAMSAASQATERELSGHLEAIRVATGQ